MTPADQEFVFAAPAERDEPSPTRTGRVWWLWLPRRREIAHRLHGLDRRGWIGAGALGLLALALWAVVFMLFQRVLAYLLQVDEFGPLLTYKLLAMVLMGFFSVLLFSNLISALSTFYLSRDLDRLRSSPIPMSTFYQARLGETALDSSWMVLMFAVPAFLAFGVAHGAGPSYYVATALALPPFLAIPAALGVIAATLVVTVLPAHRTRQVLLLLGAIAVALVYLFLRVIRPERMLDPEGFADFVDFLAELRAPASPYLPSTWVAELIHPRLATSAADAAYYFALLATTATLTVLAGQSIVARLHLLGWTRSQEGRPGAVKQIAPWEQALRRVVGWSGEASQGIVVKEIKVFLRDSSQWSQLILLFSLVVVYVYNFSVLPAAGGPLVTFYFRNVVSFLNLALAAFVMAAVAVRFVYPSISLEGQAFWILKSAPIDLGRVWWAKFWVALVPLLGFGQVLVIVTNSYLGVTAMMHWIAGLTMAGLAFGVVALGMWVGATYPRFRVENAAKISAGVGGILYMTSCMLFIAAVVLLEAWPVYAIFSYRLSGAVMPWYVWLSVAASFAAAALLCVVVFVVSWRKGIDRLRALDP